MDQWTVLYLEPAAPGQRLVSLGTYQDKETAERWKVAAKERYDEVAIYRHDGDRLVRADLRSV